jgi:hypothetical protein
MLRVATQDGTKCSDTAAENFIWSAVRDFRNGAGCDIRANEPQPLYSQTLKGSEDTKLSFIVGEGRLKQDWLYELTFTEPAGVHVDSVSGCIDFEKLKAEHLPKRVCEVRVVVGAVLTVITYKAFEATSKEGSASYLSLIRVGGQYAGEVSSVSQRPILSVDTREASQYFSEDTNGYLNLPKPDPEKLDQAVASAAPKNPGPLLAYDDLGDSAERAPLVDFATLEKIKSGGGGGSYVKGPHPVAAPQK